jgi:8-oxo-dGTP pyrophosphatase MutT (NUDIX family)
MKHASGAVLLSMSTGNICLQFRSDQVKHSRTWCFWGGKSEPGEKPVDTLLRELEEEIGFLPMIGKIVPLHTYTSKDESFEYHTYVVTIPNEIHPRVNHETAGYCWTTLSSFPTPLHFGAKIVLLNKNICAKIQQVYDMHKDTLILNNFAKNIAVNK